MSTYKNYRTADITVKNSHKNSANKNVQQFRETCLGLCLANSFWKSIPSSGASV